MKHSLLETAIGAIVLIAAGVFLVFSYTTAHQGEAGIMSGSYRLSAIFENIGGLKIGDPVMISGVKIGTVGDINLDNKLYRAEVAFNVADTIKLARDSSARISSVSMLGGKYLDIQPGGDDADLQDGDQITLTQAPANLEDLLGRFIFSMADQKKKDKPGSSAPQIENSGDEPEHP